MPILKRIPGPMNLQIAPYLPVIISLSWALLASAMLLESDVYRYAAIALLVFCWTFHRAEFNQLKGDWLAQLCFVWALYAFLRFAWGIVVHGEKGASEWLYIFPLLIPWLGACLYATRDRLFAAVTFLIVAGFVGLLLTLDINALVHGERFSPLYHHNPIHAAVGCGLLFISSVYWLAFAAETTILKTTGGKVLATIAIVTALLCLVGIFGAKSKGVWLAFSIVFGFMSITAVVHYGRRHMLVPGAIALLLCIFAAFVTFDNIKHYAGPTVVAAFHLSEQAMSQEEIEKAMANSVGKADTPESMRERLMLWTNALDIFLDSPVIGSGNLWLAKWRSAKYANVGYTLIHNGYLEILVRHGLLGMAMLLVFAATAVYRIRLAWKRGLIPSSLMLYLFSMSLFFFITMASNSNNRLAIGESFFLLAGAAVFAISIMLRADARSSAPTIPA